MWQLPDMVSLGLNGRPNTPMTSFSSITILQNGHVGGLSWPDDSSRSIQRARHDLHERWLHFDNVTLAAVDEFDISTSQHNGHIEMVDVSEWSDKSSSTSNSGVAFLLGMLFVRVLRWYSCMFNIPIRVINQTIGWIHQHLCLHYRWFVHAYCLWCCVLSSQPPWQPCSPSKMHVTKA